MIGFWQNRTHNLSKMSLADLVVAFVTYPATLVYLTLSAIGFYLVALWYQAPAPLIVAIILTGLVYPLVWYVLHPWVLRGQYLYRSRLTAKLWKRIHFDHRQDPHNLSVLFGALHTTLPAIAAVTLPVGYAVGGRTGAAMAFSAGLLVICFYEFSHCVQHLNTTPKFAFMRRIKRLHLAHHFHNERGNFGITNFAFDRPLGTYYANVRAVPKSPTVFNIGYTGAMVAKHPWVSELPNFTRGDGNPRRFRNDAAAPGTAAFSGQ